nr:membrane metallo-endopeptidase-like 1 [Drosophila bipectinata]
MGTRTCTYFLLLLGTWSVASSSDVNTRILESIPGYVNTSADPCRDFYQYIGGNKAKRHETRYTNKLGEIREKVNQRLVPIFEDLRQRKFIDELGVEEKVWRFYKSCERTINATGSERAYLKLVAPSKDLDWPQFASSPSQWRSARFNLMNTLANLRNYAVNDIFFNTMLFSDFYNTNRQLVTIDAPHNGKKQAPFLSESSLKELLIRLDVSILRATYLAKAICLLEKEIRQLPQGIEVFPTIFTVSEMEDDANGGLRWRKFLKTYTQRDIDSDFELQVYNIEYFRGLGPLLKKYDNEVIVSYIMVRFVDFVTNAGYYPTGDNSYDCINVVGYQMQFATKFLYENRYLGEGELQKYTSEIQRIFQAISTKLLRKLEENHFQLTDTQNAALQAKLVTLDLNFNNMPSIISHRLFVQAFYQDLELTGDEDYPAAQLKVLKSTAAREISNLNEPTPRGSAFFSINSLQNDYEPATKIDFLNTLIIESAVLQEPYFAYDSHDIFKVSFLGVMMASDIISEFLPYQIFFDSQGNINDLFNNLDENQHFVEGLECVNKSQPAYPYWNMLSITGTQLAYDTYFDSDSIFNQKQPEFTSIPLKKLFFQNAAKIFLNGYLPKTAEGEDPEETTLKEIFRNTKGFSEAFQCPQSEDGMNPPVKCKFFES